MLEDVEFSELALVISRGCSSPSPKDKKKPKKTDVIDLIGVVVEPGRSLHAHHPVIFAAIGRLAPSSQKPLGDDRQDAPQLNLQ